MSMEHPYYPPWSRRALSTLDMGTVGSICRTFLLGFATTEIHGLDNFLSVVDKRRNPEDREKGLITVSNHVSVLDDPMIWGAMPFRYLFNPENSRWSLGSYDICFKNGERSLLSAFFSYGNTLPMHRAAYSKYGGLFQSTMTQAIRLLSDPNSANPTSTSSSGSSELAHDDPLSPANLPVSDPFSSSGLTYTTTGLDSFPAPSYYTSRRFNWVHIFPEGKIHQHPDKFMRYFKWGVARLILESEPCPDLLPIWIDGPQEVMSENRTWPRPMPRAGKHIAITFGDCVDTESIFGEYRRRWQALKDKATIRRRQLTDSNLQGIDEVTEEEIGVLRDDFLKYSPEAQQLRIEVAHAVRNEVLKVRRSTGLSDEDPKSGLAETWREEGSRDRTEGRMKDGSIVKDM